MERELELSGSGSGLENVPNNNMTTMAPNSTDSQGFFDSETNIIALVASGGGILILIILLLLMLFCITTILLCKIFRRLQSIQPENGSKNISDKVTTVARELEDVKHEERTAGDESNVPPHNETKFSNSENADPIPSGHDSTAEGMYATISEEHREKKKMAKLTVQQYDDINLLMEGEGAEGGEDVMTRENELNMVSVTMEVDDGGYSRLVHAGPRMKDTKRKHSPSSISNNTDTSQQQQMSKKEDVSAAAAPTTTSSKKNEDDKQYSEIQPVRPHSKLVVPSTTGSYSLISAEDKEPGTPPMLPKRTRASTIIDNIELPSIEPVGKSDGPIPYQNVSTSDTVDLNQGSGYSVVGRPAAPSVIDTSFFDDVLEFRNTKAQESLGTEKLYTVMN